jgi:hypothetical protein
MATTRAMYAETRFIINGPDPIHLLKNEAIDRLDSIVDDMPKYKKNLEELILNFRVDDMLCLINTIYRDREFKLSAYYGLYNDYFDEIEELIHKYI